MRIALLFGGPLRSKRIWRALTGVLVFMPLRPLTATAQAAASLSAAQSGNTAGEALTLATLAVLSIGLIASVAERVINELYVFPLVKRKFWSTDEKNSDFCRPQ